MHATLRQGLAAGPDGPISGTFIPEIASRHAGAAGALPKILAVLAVMAFVRMLIAKSHRHGAGSMHDRRRAMIAELHRELHAADDTAGKEVPA